MSDIVHKIFSFFSGSIQVVPYALHQHRLRMPHFWHFVQDGSNLVVRHFGEPCGEGAEIDTRISQCTKKDVVINEVETSLCLVIKVPGMWRIGTIEYWQIEEREGLVMIGLVLPDDIDLRNWVAVRFNISMSDIGTNM